MPYQHNFLHALSNGNGDSQHDLRSYKLVEIQQVHNPALHADLKISRGARMQYVNGFLFGAGFMTAVLVFKVLFHVSI